MIQKRKRNLTRNNSISFFLFSFNFFDHPRNDYCEDQSGENRLAHFQSYLLKRRQRRKRVKIIHYVDGYSDERQQIHLSPVCFCEGFSWHNLLSLSLFIT